MKIFVSQAQSIASLGLVVCLLLASCSTGKQKYPDGIYQKGQKSYQGGPLVDWQNKARPWLIDQLGIAHDLSLPEKQPAATFTFVEQGFVVLQNNLRLYHISYHSFDGKELFGSLLVPTTDKARMKDMSQGKSTLIILHGHSMTKEDVIFDPDGTFKSVATKAAAQGAIVLVPDQRTFGENQEGVPHYSWVEKTPQDGSFMSTQILDVIAAQRALEALDLRAVGLSGFVGTEDNKIAGLSLGGYVALLAGAVDLSFELVNVQGHFFPFEDLFSEHHCACQQIPGLSDQINISDLALLIPPRQLKIGLGLRDSYITGCVKTALETLVEQAIEGGVGVCRGASFSTTGFLKNESLIERSKQKKDCEIILEIDKTAGHEFVSSSAN